MKKVPKANVCLTFLLILLLSNSINAQWTVNVDNSIYYTKGNVGVGTTDPQSLFSLGTILNNKKLALYDKPTSWYGFGIQGSQMRLQIGNTSARFSFFTDDTTEIMTLKGNRRLGLGTTNPAQEFHIVNPSTNADIRLQGGNDANAYLDIYSGATESGLWKYGTGGIKFGTDNTQRMHITQEGNVGIGTTIPQTLFSLGTNVNNKKLALYDKAGSWYGFGIQANQMRLQVGGTDDRFSFFAGDDKEIMTIKGNGKVGIGTTDPQAELAVNGKILAKEVQVKITGWADYVFEDKYLLQPIAAVEKFIKQNKHLPNIPTAEKVEKEGIEIGKMNTLLLQKIEELTLYIIQQNKSIENIEKANTHLQNEINSLKQQLQKNNF